MTLSGTKRQYELIRELHKRGRLYQAQLEREGWNRVTMTKILREFETLELVAKEVEFRGREGTRVWYSLTPKGRVVAGHIGEIEETLRKE